MSVPGFRGTSCPFVQLVELVRDDQMRSRWRVVSFNESEQTEIYVRILEQTQFSNLHVALATKSILGVAQARGRGDSTHH